MVQKYVYGWGVSVTSVASVCIGVGEGVEEKYKKYTESFRACNGGI